MATALSRYPYVARRAGRQVFDVDRLFNDFNRSFIHGPTRPVFRTTSRLGRATPQVRHFTPLVQASETQTEYRIVAEMPGVDAADFEVLVDDGVLVLKGERKWSTWESGPAEESSEAAATDGDTPSEEQGESGAVQSSAFEKRFRFAVEVASDDIKAVYKNGLLELIVPKRIEPDPEPVNVPVTQA